MQLARPGGESSNTFDALSTLYEVHKIKDLNEIFDTLAEWERRLEGVDFAALVDPTNDNVTNEAEVDS